MRADGLKRAAPLRQGAEATGSGSWRDRCGRFGWGRSHLMWPLKQAEARPEIRPATTSETPRLLERDRAERRDPGSRYLSSCKRKQILLIQASNLSPAPLPSMRIRVQALRTAPSMPMATGIERLKGNVFYERRCSCSQVRRAGGRHRVGLRDQESIADERPARPH